MSDGYGSIRVSERQGKTGHESGSICGAVRTFWKTSREQYRDGPQELRQAHSNTTQNFRCTSKTEIRGTDRIVSEIRKQRILGHKGEDHWLEIVYRRQAKTACLDMSFSMSDSQRVSLRRIAGAKRFAKSWLRCSSGLGNEDGLNGMRGN